jgi:maltose/moltooligosaccharide transporter
MSESSMQRKKMSFWHMSFGFLGIQFGFALQNANTSRIFSTLGAETDKLAFLWSAAPITGFLIQPLIGYYSDRTWHPVWGRRRPYFTVGAILASLALCLMPNSPALWVAVGILWIMDASINISMEPFRAFVGDMLPAEQRTQGFAMQSFFIGVGAVVASMLPYAFSHWLGISNKAAEGIIPDSVKYSFYVGGGMLFITVMWTVFTTKEYPPDKNQEALLTSTRKKGIDHPESVISKFKKTGVILLGAGILLTSLIFLKDLEKELYILCIGAMLLGVVFLFCVVLINSGKSHLGIVHMVNDFLAMPTTMVQLAFVQFFSWLALFSMWIYTTPAITEQVFGSTDTTSQAYNEGADWVNILFATYNGVAAIAALLLPILARYTSRRLTHLIALSSGGVGLISIYFIHDSWSLLYPMVGIGIAWASILSIPYAMLSGSLPPEKMGYYMGVFNFFIVIPQIIAATVLGFFLRHVFHQQPIYILVTGGISMIIAGLLCLKVNDADEVTVR